MRGRYAACLAAAAAVALSACGGLSTDSPVRQGRDVGSVQENEVRVEANPVAPGSSPEQVVSGFIRAAAASDDQYEVARSYLAASQEGAWRPDSSVVVFTDDSAVTYIRTGESSVKAVVKAIAVIDGSGRYHELPTNSTREVTFGLQRADGQWRISKLPDGFGTWLSDSDVTRLYDPFRIYFLAPSGRRLVPDIRWFPNGTGLATRLARALLVGVPEYLKGAVRSEVPPGTRLAVDSVPISSGTAKVDFTATRLGSDPAQLQALGAQFLATVGQAPGVARVSLQLEGADLQLPGGETSLESLSALGFSTQPEPTARPVLRRGTALVHVDPDRLGDPGEKPPAQQGNALPVVPTGWAYLAISPSGEEVAAVGGDHRQLVRWQGKTQLGAVDPGLHLTPPTYDSQGVLWVGGQADGTTRLWALNSAADPTDASKARPEVVRADWLSGRTLVSLRFSPDGQRVAVISTDPQGRSPRVDVAGVVRQPNGIPVSLAENLTLAPSLTRAVDLVWVDEATLAVLGRKANQVIRPWFVPLGGPIAAGPEIAGAQSITTVNAERGLVVTTDQGQVLIRAGNRWQNVGQGTAFLVPGR